MEICGIVKAKIDTALTRNQEAKIIQIKVEILI